MASQFSSRNTDGHDIRANMASLWLFIIEICALCLPAWINRSPLIFADTRAYYLGGLAALDKISSVLRHVSGTSEIGGESIDAAMQKAKGVRSAFYSLFTYIPAATVSLWLVILLQAVIIASILRLIFKLLCPGQPMVLRTLFIVGLSMLTTLSWTTSNVMPDIFTAVVALSLIIVVLFWTALSTATRFALFIAIAAGITMHLTNLPMAVGLLIIALLVAEKSAWFRAERYLQIGLIGTAIGTAVAAMLLVGVVGFKQWTLTPQAPPFMLARSITDGPGKLYLLEHCPQLGSVMCNHLDKLDQTTDTFMWKPDGVFSAVSPEEQARLRTEDKRFYLAAAKEHPWLQLGAAAQNTVIQLFTFGLREYYIPSSADVTPTNLLINDPRPEDLWWQFPFSIPIYLVVGIALASIARQRKTLSRTQRDFVILIFATVLLEAVAGAFSEPVPRYEARVVWLIPMTAVLLYFNTLNWRRARD